MKDEQEYKLITVKRSRGGVVVRETLRGKQIKVKAQFSVHTGDFVMSNRQIVHGACGLVPNTLDGSIVSNEYTVLHAREELLNLEFFSLLSHTQYFQQTCFHSSIGVDVEKMVFKLEKWFDWPINLPPLEEQIQIAEILSTWDAALENLNKLLEGKRRLKQGLMQQLLTGRVRFKEFEARGEAWEEVKIESLAKLTAGGTPSTTNPSYWNGDIPWMSSGDVHKRLVFDVSGRITKKGLENSSTKYIPENSVLVALAGQGKTRGTVAINKIRLCTNQSIAAIIPDFHKITTEYVFYNLHSRYDELRALSSGDGGRGGLNLTLLGAISLHLPPLEEQRKIAVVLSTLDLEISTLEGEKAALERQKRGLMGLLLTGKVRVGQGGAGGVLEAEDEEVFGAGERWLEVEEARAAGSLEG